MHVCMHSCPNGQRSWAPNNLKLHIAAFLKHINVHPTLQFTLMHYILRILCLYKRLFQALWTFFYHTFLCTLFSISCHFCIHTIMFVLAIKFFLLIYHELFIHKDGSNYIQISITKCLRCYISILIMLVVSYGTHQLIGLVNRVFPNGPEDQCSIPGRFIPNTLKMVLDTSLLNTQHYKLCIKGKVEQSSKRSSTLSYTSVWYLLKWEPLGRPRLRSPTYFYFYGTQIQQIYKDGH